MHPAPVTDMRQKILDLEGELRKMEPIDLETVHHFAPGVYMRELKIPQGVTLTGKIHKTEHLNILSHGVIKVWTEAGMRTLSGSSVIKSKPGIKRVGHALTDSVWITVHPNPDNIEDVKKLEDLLVVERFDQLETFMEEKKQIQGKD